MVWGAVAFALLLIGLGSAAMAIVLSLRLTALDLDHEASARLVGVYDRLQDLTTDLLVVVTADNAEARLPAARASWRRIAADIADLCKGEARPTYDDRLHLVPVCARFEAAVPMVDALLSQDVVFSPQNQRMAVERLAELIDSVRSFDKDRNKLSADQSRRLAEQKQLLVILSGATAGGLLSGVALAYVVTGAAAAHRRRWLAASEAERAATDTRAQLMEAIEAIPVGFGLYDRDARLMMFNDRLASMNRAIYT